MLGSSDSIACANIMLNSAVADTLRIYADRLEGAEDFETALHEMIQKTIKDHKRIIFNGNGYDSEWIKEATEKRGLLNYRTTPDCIPHLVDKKNVDMLTSLGVFSEKEVYSRCEIQLENYCKTVIIEANTMVSMAKTEILPAVTEYASELAKTAKAKKEICQDVACGYECKTLKKLSSLTDAIAQATEELEDTLMTVKSTEDFGEMSELIRDKLIAKMSELRISCDMAESITAKKYWPYPSYADILFSVK